MSIHRTIGFIFIAFLIITPTVLYFSPKTFEVLTPLATFWVAIAALLAVIASVGHIQAAERSNNMVLLKSFLDDYGSKEMNEAGKLLRAFSNEGFIGDRNGEYAQAFVNLGPGTNSNLFNKVDDARRRVKYYFFTAGILKKAGLLPDEILSHVISFSLMDLLFEVAEPFEILLTIWEGSTYREKEWENMANWLKYTKRKDKVLNTLKDMVREDLIGLTARGIRNLSGITLEEV